ncbi:hybrid sensor histidine kinase/response regulator [Pseudooceanicola algae]|uniref:histidine kinase n=1 Tax=Pseudooceanicola algae TaxID=1537215 RepID=A0A418SJY5_9RHOB|nr:ATP-binding protein [Pseudooceanicola algae]QPM88804.1 Sensor histidine kinase RcsC [Pseudooceanicola algae]
MSLMEDNTAAARLWTRGSAAVIVFVFCVGLVGGMALLVLREVETLSGSNTDTLQWSIAQADLELMQFRLAIEQSSDSPTSLQEVRPRFDIFYSRFRTLEEGPIYEMMRNAPELALPRRRIQAFLDYTAPYIDGSDAALRAALPQIEARADEAMQDVRAMSLSGLSTYSQVADGLRDEVAATLVRLAAVLAVVLAGLVLLAMALWRINSLAQLRSAEVQRTAGRMQTIVETSLDAIVLSDEAGRIREFNSSAQSIFGYTRDEARQADMLDLLFPPESRDAIVRNAARYFQDRRADAPTPERTLEVRACARGGRSFPAEMSFDRADGEDGPVYVAYIRDISRRKAAEDGLTEARDRALAGERAKAEFLAVMSHEMRTPLNGLLGTMQLLRDHDLGPKETELLNRMQASGRLLLGLVNDVLDLAKFEAGKLVAERQPFSIGRMLDRVVETTGPMAADQGNRLRWRWEGTPQDAVYGDVRRLRQVLLNLVGNALKFTRDGLVEIEVEIVGQTEPEIEIRVSDTGIGISETDLDRIFNDFETLDSSYARQAGGTGLGLGIARRLTGLMGGTIGAESEPEEGSLFWLRIPLEPADPAEAERIEVPAPAQAAALPDASGSRAGLSILLVEDNEINRFVARAMLQADGHEVTEAVDGAAGVAEAEARVFDVILMDISMPVMDGQEAARRIRAGAGPSARTPILAVTAHALPEEVARFRDSGMDQCISKPLDRTELRDALAEVLPAAAATKRADAGTDEGADGVAPVAADPVPPKFDPADLLDTVVLGQLWSDIPEAARDQLLHRFLEETEAEVARLASEGPAADGIAARAHKIAGSCAAFGLRGLRLRLAEIETMAKSGPGKVPADKLLSLPAFWAASRKALLDWAAMVHHSD